MSTSGTSNAERLLARLADVRKCGDEWMARCPAHDDRNPSLSIKEGAEGKILLYCHAGCKTEAVVHALGLSMSDLMPTGARTSMKSTGAGVKTRARKARYFESLEEATKALEAWQRAECSHVWNYHGANGQLVGRVLRWDDHEGKKKFCQISRNRNGWACGGMPSPCPLYRLQEVLTAPAEEMIFIVEGEKAADAAHEIGLIATTSVQGARSAKKSDWSVIAGRDVVILPDHDDTGEKYAQDVAELANDVGARSVRIVRLVDLWKQMPVGGDIVDFLERRGGDDTAVREIRALVERTEPLGVGELWNEFCPLSNPVSAPFPVDVLPGLLRHWVKAEALATQTPPEMSALLVLSVVSAVLAKRVMVEPWPGWREPTNLFVLIALEPGNRKSAVVRDATAPLRQLETQLIEEQRPIVECARTQRQIDEERLHKLKKRAAENDDAQAREEALALAAKLAQEPLPALPRLIVDNATPEKIEMLLAEQKGRIASISAEGGVFDIMAGQYSKSPNFDVYLKGHAGDDLVTDRIGRSSVHVESPALACGYAVQPEVLSGLLSKPWFRGRGLLARFLFAVPRTIIGHRDVCPPPMPSEVQQEYSNLISCLYHAINDDDVVLSLNAEAEALFKDWASEIEADLKIDGRLAHLRDWGAKLAGHTLRLAGIFHMVKSRHSKDIDADTIKAAITVARWAIRHAEAAFSLMGGASAETTGAIRVWEWIQRHRMSTFTARDVWQALRRQFDRRSDLDAAFGVLVDRGYIRMLNRLERRPGPKSIMFEVRPGLWEG